MPEVQHDHVSAVQHDHVPTVQHNYTPAEVSPLIVKSNCKQKKGSCKQQKKGSCKPPNNQLLPIKAIHRKLHASGGEREYCGGEMFKAIGHGIDFLLAPLA